MERTCYQFCACQGERDGRGEKGDYGERSEEGSVECLRHGRLHCPLAGEHLWASSQDSSLVTVLRSSHPSLGPRASLQKNIGPILKALWKSQLRKPKNCKIGSDPAARRRWFFALSSPTGFLKIAVCPGALKIWFDSLTPDLYTVFQKQGHQVSKLCLDPER